MLLGFCQWLALPLPGPVVCGRHRSHPSGVSSRYYDASGGVDDALALIDFLAYNHLETTGEGKLVGKVSVLEDDRMSAIAGIGWSSSALMSLGS